MKQILNLSLLSVLLLIATFYACSGGGIPPVDVCQFVPKDSPACQQLGCSGCTVPPTTSTTTSTTSTTSTTTTSTIPTTTTTTLVPVPPTPPPIKFCKKINVPTTCPLIQQRVFKDALNAALSRATKCPIGQICTVINWQKAIVDVMIDLNNQDFCTSYDLQGGNSGLGSELGIRVEGGAFSEFYQPITSLMKTRWADSRSVCKPAFDEEILPEVIAAWQLPVPVPTPTPSPIPPGTCPVKVEGDYFVDLVISKIGGNPQLWTASAKYCGFPIRSDIFPKFGTKCCILGVDGVDNQNPSDPRNVNPIPCEQELSGTPGWRTTGSLVIQQFGDNPYNVKVLGGSGTLQACGKSGCSNIVSF